jgi:hypothetical protein
MNEGTSINDLEIQKFRLLDRIKRLEEDMRSPLEANLDEQASQNSNQIILQRLLEVERSNLRKINYELDVKRQYSQKRI